MADEYILKEYEGGAVATTLSALISAGATSIAVTSGSSFPTGSSAPYVVVIDRGLSTEEKVLITSRSANTLTVQQRGYDGTVAQGHASGAAINHCIDAYTLKQANALANVMTTQYDIPYRGASGAAFGRIAVGSNGHMMQVTAGVPGFAALGLANIADGLITEAKLAAAVQSLLVPAGTVCTTIAAAAPTGWLFHNQAVVNAQTLYAALWAAAPASWKSGSTLNIPSLTDMTLMQAGTTALGATGGANTRTIAEANLPAHVHTLGSHTHTGSSGNASADHTHAAGTLATSAHSVTDPGHTHIQSIVPNGVGSGTYRADFTMDTTTGSVFSQDNVATASGTTGISIAAHTLSGSTGGHSVTHTHTVTVNAASGNTGSIGSGTALTTTPLHLAVNWMIKAH